MANHDLQGQPPERWIAEAFRESARLGRLVESLDAYHIARREDVFEIPPEQMEYLRELIRVLLDGRDIVAAYNYVMLALLALFTALHLWEKRRCRKQWQQKRKQDARRICAHPDTQTGSNDDSSLSSSSSSSSCRITTPSGAVKDVQLDLEGLPLLGQHKTTKSPGSFTRARRRASYWLGYQPRPLPIVNRVLPSNAVSLFIIFWLGINIFFHVYQVRLLELEYFFCFADRAGYVFIVNLPLLYLLAAKNQPLRLLTGRSYESLNIFHRRVGEFMCFEGVVHFIGMLIWQFTLEPDWLTGDMDAWAYFTHPLVVEGIGTFLSYELLYFTSLGSFRQRWYELFLASHVTLQILALIFLYLHFHTARPYVLASLVIFVVDRAIWRLGLKSTTITGDLTVLPDGETFMLSANWDKPTSRSSWFPWPRHNIRHGWKPTDHVFLTVPALGRTHALQAHPFTIASAAPSAHRTIRGDDGQDPTHCWLSLLIRAHRGFTADLLNYAHHHQHVPVRLDGPYGSTHALDMLRAADTAILVAGGSGIAVTFPLVWALLMDDHVEGSHDDDVDDDHDITKMGICRRGKMTSRKVHMLWVIHSDEHRAWVPQEMLDELVAAGLDLIIPPPTTVSGRPDVVGTVDGWIEEASACGGQAAVVVSGPDGLNRMVRNTCTQAIGRGADVHTVVEKFGW
ncbi:Ferric/cupric reductase transmembrane component 2 [Cytospora mali]|uniref:Ferric/cupric reductase transmembrane component 2 n=1 Tax=Cytospora mali TaxID=578113 RepID=A0A194W0S0_CYTMA|nr:Ferric/cupric reductase transmembrane component 2 [Valsa mali]